MSAERSSAQRIDDVLALEDGYITRRKRQVNATDVAVPLVEGKVGLALSGGGIRSATTALGLLQELAALRLLPVVDYLSTVSGGGYIGGCLSSLLSLSSKTTDGVDDYGLEAPDLASFNTGASGRMPLGEPRQVAHLRTHGNFLIARSGLLKRDALRAVGNLFAGLLYSVSFVALTLLALSGFTLVAAVWLAGDLSSRLPRETGALQQAAGLATRFALDLDSLLTTTPALVWLGLALVPVVFTVLALDYFVYQVRRPGLEPRPGESPEERRERASLSCVAAALAAVVVLVTVVVRVSSPAVWLPVLFLPAALLLIARLAGLGVSWLLPRLPGLWTREVRSVWGAYQSIALYGFVGFTVLALIPVAAHVLADSGPENAAGALLSLVASWLLAPKEDQQYRLPSALARPLLGVAVWLFLLFAMVGWSVALLGVPHPFWIATAATGVLVLVGWLVDFNRVSLHYFYRDRLAETYLRTEVAEDTRRPSPMKVSRDSMAMRLQDLHGEGDAPVTTAPYHLINAAINLAGSRDLTRKDRKSGYFLLSKYFCGSKYTGYRRTSQYRDGKTKLARAVTISGAAAGSGAGIHTFFAQAFAATLFNVRLGSWMENPAWDRTFKRKEDGVFWPWLMLREMFTDTDARGRLVNLSDGGHTGDNLGIYPLLQRQCQVIIACDAEADSELSFGSFSQAIRQAYVDFGVEVDIDLDLIRPDPETGRSRSHCAVGRIKYPGGTPNRKNWIVYIKNSLTGDEPAPVQNYKQDHTLFPHESTADQFFDDDQFESYRALGVHLAQRAFGPWLAQTVAPTWEELAQLHAPFRIEDATRFHDMTRNYVEIQRTCAAAVDEDAQCEWAVRMQLMEDVYFAVRLDRYPNAPCNRGWMNLFREWGRLPAFARYWLQLQHRHAITFVTFCNDHLIDRPAIDHDPVPHPWDFASADDRQGVFFDSGMVIGGPVQVAAQGPT